MGKPPFVLPLKTAPSPFPGRLDIFDATDSWYVEFKEDVATAIVTACNSHDELVAALSELIPMFAEWHREFPEGIGDKEGPALARAQAALAKAGARP